MMTQMQVHLYRDSFTTPWGIRLQGGKDLTSPLVVQRVFPNTPAAGYLQRGDILLSLNGKDAGGLTHKQAQDVFQFAGGQIPLIIRRPNIESRNPPPAKPQQQQQFYPQQVQPQQPKPQASSTVIKTRNQPKKPSTTMPPTQKSSTTPLRKTKIESSKSSKGKGKKHFGGGGFSFGVDYSKVEVQDDYVPGPIYTEEEQADELDQTYRTVPLDLEGPTKMAHPHVPKGGMKYGGGGPSYGVSYTPPAGVQRQSSKPWEDNEMLHKVQDTLAHRSQYQVSSYNGGPPVHYQHVAPPAYVPGPPPPSDSSYIDPFPSFVPPKPEEEDDEYEFLPVSQRRNQFSKQDFVSDVRKPSRTRGRPQTYHAPPPPPAPRPAPRPVVQPVYAPMSRPAEGQVVQDETPAWAGTLSSASGAKMWDVGFQPSHHVSPPRSVSPSKKSGKKPPAPRPTQEFSPTKTQALDFSNDPEDGPRIMHLQYNSPLDMYSRENVQETLQGQTQAALGGGNTAKWLGDVEYETTSSSTPVKEYGPVHGGSSSNRSGAATSVRESRASPCKTPVRYPSPLKMVDSPTSSFYYQSSPLQSPEPVAYNQHHSPIRHVEPPRRRAPSPQPTYNPPQTYDIPSPSFLPQKQWTPVAPPVQTYNPPIETYVPPPPPPPHSAPPTRSHLPFTPTAPVKRTASAPKPRQPTAKSAPATPAAGGNVPDYSYRSWGASMISPFAKKLEQQEQAEQTRDEPVHQQTSYVTPVSQKQKPDAQKHSVFEELTSALKKSSTFPRGTYAAKEFQSSDGMGTTVYKTGTTSYSHVHFAHSYYDNGNNNSESDPGYVTPPMFFENYGERFEAPPAPRPKTVSTGIVLKLSDVPPAHGRAEPEGTGVVTIQQPTKDPSVISITPLTINIKPLVSDVAAVPPQEKPAEAPPSETTVIAAQPTATEEPQTKAETVQEEAKQEIAEESAPPAPPVDKESVAAPAEAATPAEETSSAEQVDKVETAAPPEGDAVAAPVETETKTETPPAPEADTAVAPVESTTKTEAPSTPEAATGADTQADASVQEEGKDVSVVVSEVKEVEKEASTQPDSSSTEAAPVEKEASAASQEGVQTVQESETAKTTEVKETVTSETSTASDPTSTTKTETTVETTTKSTPTAESIVETTVTTTTVTEKTETVEHSVTESSTSEEHSAPAAEDKPEPKTPEGVEDKIEASSCPPAASSKTEEPAAETAAAVKEQSAGDQEQVTTLETPTPSEPTPTVVETTAQESQPVEKLVSDGQIAAPAPREGETTADTQTVQSEGGPSVNQSQSEDTSNKKTTEIPASDTTTTTTTNTTTTTTDTTTANVTAVAAAEDGKSSADKGSESNNSGAVVDPVVVSN